MGRIRNVLLAVAMVGAGVVIWRGAIAPNVIAKRFAVVEEGKIYRSGSLSPAALKRVHVRRGVKTVVDLGTYPAGSPEDQREQQTAASLGMTRLRFDLSGDSTGNPNVYLRTVQIMADPARQPVLVHCGAGTERTGCAVILYRHIVQGMALSSAYKEAQSIGHDPGRNPALFMTLLDWAEPVETAFRSGQPVAGAAPLPATAPSADASRSAD